MLVEQQYCARYSSGTEGVTKPPALGRYCGRLSFNKEDYGHFKTMVHSKCSLQTFSTPTTLLSSELCRKSSPSLITWGSSTLTTHTNRLMFQMGEHGQPNICPPLPVEIIFSCQVCHSPISEIYRSPESDKGFRDGTQEDVNQAESPLERPVTRLWLTECAHLTCGKHLDGGGKRRYGSGLVASLLTKMKVFLYTEPEIVLKLHVPYAAPRRMIRNRRTCTEYGVGIRGPSMTAYQKIGSTLLP